MAKRKQKQNIDITADEPVQAPAAEPVAAGQPEPSVEKAVPELNCPKLCGQHKKAPM